MSKQFFEVFPTLQLDKKMKTLLESTVVERVTSNRAKDTLRVYLQSNHLLQKELIWETETQIKKQLFPNHQMEIKIQEKYVLSSQYTLENLMEAYRDSMLLEIQKYNHVLHSMFKQAKIIYPQKGAMILEVKDTVLYRDLQGELIRILEKIIVERCGISASLSLEFVEMESRSHREEDEIMIRRKVAEISERVAGMAMSEEGNVETGANSGGSSDSADGRKDNVTAKGQTKVSGSAETKDIKAKEEKKEGKEGKADYRRPQNLKRSDNPDVIYGKDFEDEAMPISEVIGEIGEVTIRGQIIALDTREIRNEKTIVFFDLTDFTDTMNRHVSQEQKRADLPAVSGAKNG